MDSAAAKLGQVAQAIVAIRPILAGRSPEVQGAILCELLSMYLAGHSPMLREEILTMHFTAVRELIPVCERELFGEAGHPDRQWQEAGT